MIKSCAVQAWGKSHSAPKGAALTFPDEIAEGLVMGGLAIYDTPAIPTHTGKEFAVSKPANKQTRKGGTKQA